VPRVLELERVSISISFRFYYHLLLKLDTSDPWSVNARPDEPRIACCDEASPGMNPIVTLSERPHAVCFWLNVAYRVCDVGSI